MPETTQPPARSLAGRLLIVAIWIVVALVLGEIALRAIGFSAPVWYQPDRTLGWVLRPGVAGPFTKEGAGLVEVNSAGWRDQEHPLDKPAGTYRIAVLGDSYAEAMQVGPRETFWAQLPGKLAACGFVRDKRIEVLNFGVSGYGTGQQYLVLESKAMRYQPDLVLLAFTNGNDVRNNSLALEEERLRPFFVPDGNGGLHLDDSFSTSEEFRAVSAPERDYFRRFADWSRIVQLLNAYRVARKAPAAQPVATGVAAAKGVEQGLEPYVLAPPKEAAWSEAWKITENLVAMTSEYVRRNGGRFLLITVPYAIQVHPDPTVRLDLQTRLGVPDLLYPDRRLADFAQQRGFDALPLAPEMQRLAEANKTYFHGFANVGLGRGHWNQDGHRVAAELIAKRLCDTRENAI